MGGRTTDLSSAYSVRSVTPSDSTVLPPGSRFLYVGGEGKVAVTMTDGTSAVLTGLAAGVMHRIQVTQVLATGTTATGILVFY